MNGVGFIPYTSPQQQQQAASFVLTAVITYLELSFEAVYSFTAIQHIIPL
jgi:hypothetical protein